MTVSIDTTPVSVFYVKDGVYEITISPSDAHQHYKSPMRLKLCVEDIRKKLLCTLAHYKITYATYSS